MKFSVAKVINSAVLASAVSFAGGAMAADGEITFVGKITSATCKINNGKADFQVNMPTISSQTLNTAGKTAGRTPFSINLSECSDGQKTVDVYFEQGNYTNPTSNRLINSVSADSNVEIQIMNSNLGIVKLNEVIGEQNGKTVNITNGGASLTYFAEYYATGPVAAGEVQSATEYTIIYP